MCARIWWFSLWMCRRIGATARIARVDLAARSAFQFAHLGLDRRLVDAVHFVMRVRLDAERFAQGGQQFLLVQ